MAKYNVKPEFLCEVEAYLNPVPIGPGSWGTRIIFNVEGGSVKGPEINGKLSAFGADWGIIRQDNCLELDVRILIETDDSVLIHTYYKGIIDMTKEQVDTFLGGAIPENLSIYVTPRFETTHEKYRWMNRIQAIGRGSVGIVDNRIVVSYSWYKLGA